MTRKSRATVGLQMALAMMIPAKAKSSSEHSPSAPEKDKPDNHIPVAAPPGPSGRWDFSRLFQVEAEPDIVGDARESAERIQTIAHNAWRITVNAAKTANHKKALAAKSAFKPKPMTHEEIRLWLQSFNAGPYACLKYKGDVPYEETRNYVPRVLKYYEEDLKTDYDSDIKRLAGKYGLDPQMIKAIMKTESDFRNDTVSHAGARGLMQIMPVVWKDIKEKYDLDWDYSTGVFEPKKNIEVGCAYLAWLRYDFLPRHFAAYPADPAAPVCLVRDKDRGVPDREGPRIIAKSDSTTKRTVETASADVDGKKVVEDSDKRNKNKDADEKSADTENDESESAETTKHSDGKTRVVMRGGKGKAVAISVGSKGQVESSSNDDKDRKELSRHKRPAVANADREDAEETQGG